MTSVLAIVSKVVFERDAPQALGAVWATTTYGSRHKSLDALAEGGALFLVTVRPPDERLWLVAILERPKASSAGWTAAKNIEPIRDISDIRPMLRFATGAGLSAKRGALGMSLQTPRALTDDDVALLRGARRAVVDTSATPANAAHRSAPHKATARATPATTIATPAIRTPATTIATPAIATPATTIATPATTIATPAKATAATTPPTPPTPAKATAAKASRATKTAMPVKATTETHDARPARPSAMSARAMPVKPTTATGSATPAEPVAAPAGGGDLDALVARAAWPEAVDALLALWRTTREPKVADVLDALAARTPRTAPASSAGLVEAQAAWLKWVTRLPATDVPSALATFDAARVKSKPALARLELLGKRPADPRLGRFLVALLANPPFQSTGTQPFWKALLQTLPDHADAQVLARLEALVTGGVRRVGARTMGEWFDTNIAKAIPLVRARAGGTPLDPALQVRCAAWLARLSTGSGENRRAELFAAVYATPADDGPREVLADFLQHAGDPHGELIALQLSRAEDPRRTERIAELLRKHPKAFVAPELGKVLKAVTYARGFPAAGRFDARTGGDLRRAIGAPAWATLDTLHPGYFDAHHAPDVAVRHELLLTPALRHLSTIWVDANFLIRLVKLGGPFPWRTLAIESRTWGDWSDSDPVQSRWQARPAALTEALLRPMFPNLEHVMFAIERPTSGQEQGFANLIANAPWLARLQITTTFAPAAATAALVPRLTVTPGLSDPFDDKA